MALPLLEPPLTYLCHGALHDGLALCAHNVDGPYLVAFCCLLPCTTRISEIHISVY